MRLPFKGWKIQTIIEFIIVYSIANFIGITLFAGMIFCMLECKAPWGKQ